MDELTKNPGLEHISQNIFWLLDHESQMTCRQVNHCWKAQLDRPYFWVKKCDSKGQSKELSNAWIHLIRATRGIENGSHIKQEMRECLMKFYGQFHEFSELNFLNGISPIHVACICGSLDLLKYISNFKEFLKFSNSDGINPLCHVIWREELEMVKFLAPKLENYNAVSEGIVGATPIYIATMMGRTEIVKFLATMEDQNDLNSPDEDGDTLMSAAAEEGHIEIVKFLSSKVVNPNEPDGNGWTPIHIAANFGHIEVVEYLSSFTENPNAPGPFGYWTPLKLAKENGHHKVVKKLLKILQKKGPLKVRLYYQFVYMKKKACKKMLNHPAF